MYPDTPPSAFRGLAPSRRLSLLVVAALAAFARVRSDAVEGDGGAAPAARPAQPADYAYASSGARVHDLVRHFETMSTSNFLDPEVRRKQSVVISVSEAASKLRALSDGYPLDAKCTKYVKLINQPNIRTFASVNLLVGEEKLASETEQPDANLVPRLAHERAFDALGRLHTLALTLESERAGGRSLYEPAVQRDLLDCINYYIYRHQRATLGLIDYVRESSNKLAPLVVQPSGSDVVLRKFREHMGRIRGIEAGSPFDVRAWLEELAGLQELVSENQHEIPKLVRDFIADPARLARLGSMRDVLDRSEELEQRVLELAGRGEQGEEHSRAVSELGELCVLNKDLVPPETCRLAGPAERAPPAEPETVPSPPSADELAPDQSASDRAAGVEDEATIVEAAPEAPSPLAARDDKPAPAEELSERRAAECKRLSGELNRNLREFSLGSLDLGRAESLAARLTRFNSECAAAANGSRARWAVQSMTLKLAGWCVNKLREVSLPEAERAAASSLLERLRGVKG